MSKLHERKCLNKENGQGTTGFFSRGIDVLAHTPTPRCDTHKGIVTSQVTEMRALTKSLRSPSRCGGDQATYNLLLRAPTILGKLREKTPRSPRSPR